MSNDHLELHQSQRKLLGATNPGARTYYVDIETTGLRFNFANKKQPVGLIQVAFGELLKDDPSGKILKTYDFWTDHSTKLFTNYLEGSMGKGEGASTKLLQQLMSLDTPWQAGVLSMIDPDTVTPRKSRSENVVAGVLRRYAEVARTAFKEGKRDLTAHKVALGEYAQQYGVSTSHILDNIESVLNEGGTLKGWNFSYDMRELYTQAENLGKTSVMSAMDAAYREGRIIDSGRAWMDVLYTESVFGKDWNKDPGQSGWNLSLFHRSKESGRLSQDDIQRRLSEIEDSLANHKRFEPPKLVHPGSNPTGRAVELHPGFHQWLFSDDSTIGEFKAKGLIKDADMASYEKFQRKVFELQNVDPKLLERKREVFKGVLNQTFEAGKRFPDMKYVGLWSLDTISNALGLKKRLLGEGVDAVSRKLHGELHDAALDNLVARRVEEITEVFQKGATPRERLHHLDEFLRREYQMDRNVFFNRLQLYAEQSVLNKTLEKRLDSAHSMSRAGQALAGALRPPDSKPIRHESLRQGTRREVKSVKDAGRALASEVREGLSNFFKTRHGKIVGGVGALMVGHSLWAEMQGTQTALPETGQPRLTPKQVEAMPPTIRGNYLHALTQAELLQRGLATGVEVPVETYEGRGYIDAMDRAGAPIEIKTTDTIDQPQAKHARQLRKYLEATGRRRGQLLYVGSAGEVQSFGIEGLRQPKSRYTERYGILPSELQNVSDYHSGRSWYSQLVTATAFKRYHRRVGSNAERHALASLQWSQSARTDKLLTQGGSYYPLGSLEQDLRGYLPKQRQHNLLIPPEEIITGGAKGYDNVLFDRWRSRLDYALTPVRDGQVMKQGMPSVIDPAVLASNRMGMGSAGDITAWSESQTARLRGTPRRFAFTHSAQGSRVRPWSMLRQRMFPSNIRNGSIVKGEVALGTGPGYHDTKALVPHIHSILPGWAQQGMPPPQMMDFARKIHGGVTPDITFPRSRSLVNNQVTGLPRGVKGPWSTQISGIQAGQFENKFPWGSAMYSGDMSQGYEPVLGMSPETHTLVGVGLNLGFMAALFTSRGNLDLRGSTILGTTPQMMEDRARRVFDKMVNNLRVNPYVAKRMMGTVGFSEDVLDTIKEYQGFRLRGKPSSATGFSKGKGFKGKIASFFKGWGDSRKATRDWRTWVRNNRDKVGRYGPATRGRAVARLKWISGGPEKHTLIQRVSNFFLGGMSGAAYDEVTDVAEAIYSTHPDVLADKTGGYKARANPYNYIRPSRSLFGSTTLATVRDKHIRGFLLKQSRALRLRADKMLRAGNVSRSAHIGAQQARQSAKVLRAASRSVARATTAKVTMGASELFFWATETEERAKRLGGGFRGYMIGGLAAAASSAGTIGGAILGGMVPIPGLNILTSLAGAMIGSAIGGLVGDSIESVGATLFGRAKIDRNTNFVRTVSQNAYRDYMHSHIPGMAHMADATYGESHIGGQPGKTDFGSPFRLPQELRQSIPKIRPRKKVRPSGKPHLPQNLRKSAQRHKIRSQRGRLGMPQRNPNVHYNGSRGGVSVVNHA